MCANVTVNEKKMGINVKKSKEGHMRGFGWRRGTWEMM